jgi:hypothetical protein
VPVLRVLRGGGEHGGEPRTDACQDHPLVHQADPLLAIASSQALLAVWDTFLRH